MARTLRIALDITLYSIQTVRPVISSTWNTAKSSLSTTKASFVLNNPVMNKTADVLHSVTTTLENQLASMRDSQLAGELTYLEQEVKKCKEKLSQIKKTACDIVRSQMREAWPYLKVECAPPMTIALLQGSFGKSLENTVSGAAYSFRSAIQNAITSIDAAAEKKKQAEQAVIIAAQEKAKAEDQKKKLEAEKKAVETMMKIQAAAKEKAKDAKKDQPKATRGQDTSKKVEKKAPTNTNKKVDKKAPKKK